VALGLARAAHSVTVWFDYSSSEFT
jgi:hypothetical protein